MKRAHIHLRDALEKALRELGIDAPTVTLERPRDPAHGDIATNAALVNAKPLKLAPRVLADKLHGSLALDASLVSCEGVAGPGFINFRFANDYLQSLVALTICEPGTFGRTGDLSGRRVLIEFVSANPTGPLNVVSARAAAVGDSLTRIFRELGAQCDAEFYVNDAGNQVELLGQSVLARYLTLLGQEKEIPEGGYYGEYIADFAKELAAEHGDSFVTAESNSAAALLGRKAMERHIEMHRKSLEHFRVSMSNWYRESALRENEAEWQAFRELERRGTIFEQDGAKFVRTSDFGDQQDWVVVTSQGKPTYFLPDIAYHWDKFRRGYDHIIDILGPDHHSYLTKMAAAMAALGEEPKRLEIMLLQHINLLRDGEPVKMSKRAGQIVEMDELVDEVGVDAARYFFLLRRTSTPLDFDIELAKRQSDDNPVFYVQYAHARIASIFRRGQLEVPIMAEHLELLTHEEELILIRRLREISDVMLDCAVSRDPHALTAWLREVAAQFHRFYHHCRVLTSPAELQTARLCLCRATQIALQRGLALCGVHAPQEM
ncbi:MAG: arginine--tRNA ligase [bacterium]|nr:arginine--tRNA ligase [bacterium]